LELDVQDGRCRLPELLDEGFGVEASGWKGRAGTAIVSRWRTRLFYPAVARWAADTGILRLAFLRHDGRAIAFSFGLQQGGTHYGLKLGYEESYARFSPGMLILHRLTEWCFEQPEVRAFEMLGQADEYKSEFATVVEKQERVQILRAGWRGVADRREELSRAWIRRSLREHIPAPARVAMVRAAVKLGLRP
jgi:CelD/BcsL family acetyltransferase involved in cellulose biosynthesis